MPKKKRTREDKIQADKRRQSATQTVHLNKKAAVTREVENKPEAPAATSSTFSLPKEYGNAKSKTAAPASTTQTVAINTSAYNYLRGDLLKTTFLTTAIIAAELIIYFFMMK